MNFVVKNLDMRLVGLLLGPVIALLMLLSDPPAGLSQIAWYTAACMLLMAIWWMTEAVPVAVTALLPIVLFPLLGIKDIKSTTAAFAHPTVYLFLGGFLLALAIEKSNLHKRVALAILLRTSGGAQSLMGGFMITAALLSMWISNTATTIMLLPMGLAIITIVSETLTDIDQQTKENFQTALLLSIAYAATIGGVATLIGTPPNAYMAAYLMENFDIEIGFIKWMGVGLPVTIIMLPITWLLLSKVLFKFDFNTSDEIRSKLQQLSSELGTMSSPEKRVSLVFALTAVSWAFRPLLNKIPLLSGLSDSSIAIIAGISLFLLPSSRGAGSLLAWRDTSKLPWGILVLFGGGLALASAVSSSGLAGAIGNSVAALNITDLFLLVIITTTIIIFLTEMTSNLATTATFLPVIGAITIQLGYDPEVLIVPVTLAASCAFMLPVATPPNAIVYSMEKFTISQMAKAGVTLNVLSIILVSIISVFLVPAVLIALK